MSDGNAVDIREVNDLLSTNDAMVWAEQFVKTCREHNIDPVNGDDPEGFMVAWFANAMAAQEIEDRLKWKDPLDTSLRDLVIRRDVPRAV